MKKNLIYVIGSNLFNLLFGVIINFVIPMILSIEGYGYFKLFTLYIYFIGFFTFGFNDGIYLEYGKINYEEIDKKRFRLYFKYNLSSQLVLFVLLSLLSSVIFKEHRLFVLIFTVVNMLLFNLISYFNFIAQITQKFKFYSLQAFLSKFLYVLPLAFFYIFKLNDYKYVIYMHTGVNLILLLIFLIYFRKITFGRSYPILKEYRSIFTIIAIGFPLMIGNFVGILILNIDRFFIDYYFSIYIFSYYSFAVNMLSLVLLFVTALSVVLYPYLTRVNEENYKIYYKRLTDFTLMLFSMMLAVYFVLEYTIELILPKYESSLPIFSILLPVVVIRSVMSMVINNYFKVLKKQKMFFINNTIALILSIVFNFVLYYLFRNIQAIAYATLITFILWFIFSDHYFSKLLKERDLKKYLYLMLILIIYFTSVSIPNNYIGFTGYLIGYTIITVIFYRKQILYMVANRRIV